MPEPLARHRGSQPQIRLQIATHFFKPVDAIFTDVILFDARDPEQFKASPRRAWKYEAFASRSAGADRAKHGRGMEKNELMPLMFTRRILT